MRLVFKAPGVGCKKSEEAKECPVSVSFKPAPQLPVKFVRIEWTDEKQVKHTEPSESQADDEAKTVGALFPVARFKPRVDYNYGFMRVNGAKRMNFINLLDEITGYRDGDRSSAEFNSSRIYCGVIDLAGEGSEDNAGGRGFQPGEVSAGNIGGLTIAHELAHNLDRPHPLDSRLGLLPNGQKQGRCNEEGEPSDEDFPYFESIGDAIRPTLGPMTLGDDQLVYGLVTQDGDQSLRVVDPFFQFELMSYCGSKWPSKHTYTKVFEQLDRRSPGPVRTHALAVKGDFLMIRGSVHLSQKTAEFKPFAMLLKVEAPPDAQPGDYTLQLRDANGAVLRSIAFKPLVPVPEPDRSDTGSFSIAVPANANYKQAVLLHNGTVLASRSASAHAPVVEIVSPNGGENLAQDNIVLKWTGTDADGDALTYTIQFSPDGGATWEVLGVNWTQETYEISQQYFKGTGNGLIRVIASDGFNAGSDVSNGPFSVPNHAPSVAIQSPSANYLFTGPQQVAFDANATDLEDGAIANDNLKWTSSLDGSLGTGLVIQRSAATLSEGTHLITLTATDGGGIASTSVVNMVVLRVVPPNLSDLEVSVPALSIQATAGSSFSYTIRIANGARTAQPMS